MHEHYDPARDYEREQAAERDLQERDRNAEQFLGDGWSEVEEHNGTY